MRQIFTHFLILASVIMLSNMAHADDGMKLLEQRFGKNDTYSFAEVVQSEPFTIVRAYHVNLLDGQRCNLWAYDVDLSENSKGRFLGFSQYIGPKASNVKDCPNPSATRNYFGYDKSFLIEQVEYIAKVRDCYFLEEDNEGETCEFDFSIYEGKTSACFAESQLFVSISDREFWGPGWYQLSKRETKPNLNDCGGIYNIYFRPNRGKPELIDSMISQ